MLHRRRWYVTQRPRFFVFQASKLRRRNSTVYPFQGGALVADEDGPSDYVSDRYLGVAVDGAYHSGMAGRYANALFELAVESGALETVKADLARFDALVAENAEFARLVRSPVFTAEQQTRTLTAVLEHIGLRGLAAQFLLTVAGNRRLFAVRDMIRAFRELVARHKGEITAQVTLAHQPSETHLGAIKEVLSAVAKKDVQIDLKIDPALIGGLVVKLGSRMVDSSLRTKLNGLKQAMKEVP